MKIYSNTNNYSENHRRTNICRNTALMSAVVLASTACLANNEKTVTNLNHDTFHYISINEANDNVILWSENRKNKRSKWDEIPDYEKMHWLFGVGMAIVVLLNICTKNNSKNNNQDKW